MTASAALTTDLQRQVLALETDLRDRLAADAEREGEWKREHHRAVEKERTAASWTQWRDDRVTQAAVAWVLTTVFIRFCEDNALLKPVWITGPGSRRQEALDAQKEFFRRHPEDTGREWLLDAIDYLAKLPATSGLVESHSALYLIAPSGQAADDLLTFWRQRDEEGNLIHDLADPELSTRFLGDLYQDLSQHAKDTYALLQTPVFVEEFILDRTMEPALKERPLEGFLMIDPACGSGHFLLGAFTRLLDRWHKQAPGLDPQARVQKALDSINGVDLNPFAIAIARFRLLLAALQAAGLSSLEEAPAFTVNLAVGDSLIHGPDPGVLPGMSDRSAFMPFTYRTEDAGLLLALLEEGRYDVVVGNPPYITARDKALKKAYKSKYSNICSGQFHLTSPFMKLFFDLARTGENVGWIGQIVDNGFMKREFGVPLIEDFLAKIDLGLVVDTSGAYIPGHGTPTVIIVGRNRPLIASTVRAILGIRSESGRPGNPAKGLVWSTIIDHVDEPGWNDQWITVTDLDRKLLARHPWTLTGGGAVELVGAINSASTRVLRDITTNIGFMATTREDDAYLVGAATMRRLGVKEELQRPILGGAEVRDWNGFRDNYALCTYDAYGDPVIDQSALRMLWVLKPYLLIRRALSGSQIEQGLKWWEYSQFNKRRFRANFLIAFAFVATHNHFVLERSRSLYIRSAPIIKLPEDASEDDHLALLSVLNSSTGCFWLKQNSQAKAGTSNTSGGGDRWSPEPWFERYEFTGTTLQDFPLPRHLPVERARELDSIAQEMSKSTPIAVTREQIPTGTWFANAESTSEILRRRMISLQEELDWTVYHLYGIIEDDLAYTGGTPPEIALGERAFEIALARSGEDTAWFTRHGSTSTTDIPEDWPESYQQLVQRRLDLIQSHPFIRLLETPNYKRRWAEEPWETRQRRTLREWLLDRLEDRRFWVDPQGRPRPRSIAQLADEVARNADLVSVLELWEGRPDLPTAHSLAKLMNDEAVPFLAAYRYKDYGLRKREDWEIAWALQRREDDGENVGTIPVPPKYAPADFRKPAYWHARGKLDVPKERFILYPDAGRETDPTLLLGWAGWDHAQQSLALATIITERQAEGWPADKLVPLVAGLEELQPWVEQWHGEVDPAYGVSMATFCREQLTNGAAQVGKTLAELRQWRPEARKARTSSRPQ
jgi:hypothetical protein